MNITDYKKKLKLYEKLLTLWQQVYGDQAVDGPGSNPPPPPPPPPTHG